MRLAVVIPAYNEAKTIAGVVRSIPSSIPGISEITAVIVNDCSKDKTAQVARATGAVVVSHRLNMGAGAATLTGIAAAKELGSDLVVTLDADGQHDPNEIAHLVSAHVTHRADLVIGSRFLSATIAEMPPLKWYGNKIMNGITYVFSRQPVTDSQSGFRLFGPRFLKKLHHFRTAGYEFCSEAIIIAREQRLCIHEVPIRTIYFAGRAGQNWINGLHIFLRLFYRTVTG